jgi:hypothetical protein
LKTVHDVFGGSFWFVAKVVQCAGSEFGLRERPAGQFCAYLKNAKNVNGLHFEQTF